MIFMKKIDRMVSKKMTSFIWSNIKNCILSLENLVTFLKP